MAMEYERQQQQLHTSYGEGGRERVTPEYLNDLEHLIRHTQGIVLASFQQVPGDLEQAFYRIREIIESHKAYMFLPPRPGGTKTCKTCLRPY